MGNRSGRRRKLTAREMCLGEARGRGKRTVDGRECGIPFSQKKLFYTTLPRGYRSHIHSTFVSDSAPYPEVLTDLVAFILRGLCVITYRSFTGQLGFYGLSGAELRVKEGPYGELTASRDKFGAQPAIGAYCKSCSRGR